MMSGMVVIFLIFLIVTATRARGPRPATGVWSIPLPPEPQRTPEEVVRDRYAQGEIGRPEYQEMLINLLKDRYVTGELDLAEYEQRASRVLDEGRPDRGEASLQVQPPTASAEPRPRGLEAGVQQETPLEANRRRFLSGELTYQEYEKQRKRLMGTE